MQNSPAFQGNHEFWGNVVHHHGVAQFVESIAVKLVRKSKTPVVVVEKMLFMATVNVISPLAERFTRPDSKRSPS